MNDNGDENSNMESMKCSQKYHEPGADECKTELNTVNDANEDRKLGNQKIDSMAIPVDFELFTAPNIWMSDTRATVHNTPHEAGSTNKNIGTENDRNGEKVKSTAKGQIKGTATSK